MHVRIWTKVTWPYLTPDAHRIGVLLGVERTCHSQKRHRLRVPYLHDIAIIIYCTAAWVRGTQLKTMWMWQHHHIVSYLTFSLRQFLESFYPIFCPIVSLHFFNYKSYILHCYVNNKTITHSNTTRSNKKNTFSSYLNPNRATRNRVHAMFGDSTALIHTHTQQTKYTTIWIQFAGHSFRGRKPLISFSGLPEKQMRARGVCL